MIEVFEASVEVFKSFGADRIIKDLIAQISSSIPLYLKILIPFLIFVDVFIPLIMKFLRRILGLSPRSATGVVTSKQLKNKADKLQTQAVNLLKAAGVLELSEHKKTDSDLHPDVSYVDMHTGYDSEVPFEPNVAPDVSWESAIGAVDVANGYSVPRERFDFDSRRSFFEEDEIDDKRYRHRMRDVVDTMRESDSSY